MYAKTLVPGPHPIPALIATTDDAEVLLPQLLHRGWALFGDPPASTSAGRLLVGQDRLRLVVDNQALLDDINPWAPGGWWSAVDRLHGRCLVVIVAAGDVDLAHDQAGGQLRALMGTRRAVAASLPVETVLTR